LDALMSSIMWLFLRIHRWFLAVVFNKLFEVTVFRNSRVFLGFS
jgi:hypothetical protein